MSNDNLEKEDEPTCGRPCDPSTPCEECVPYWDRMVAEKYWDRERHRWTDKGWKEIIR